MEPLKSHESQLREITWNIDVESYHINVSVEVNELFVDHS